MLIGTLSPAETIRWFEEIDQDHEFLCCMITADPMHREIVRSIAQNFVDADAALGRRVGIVLFGGTLAKNYKDLGFLGCTRAFLPGEILRSSIVPLRAFVDNRYQSMDQRELEPLGPEFYEYLAHESTKIAADWMDLVGINREELPALCVLIKGADPVILPLGSSISEQSLLKIFGRLADIAQRDSSSLLRVAFDAEQSIKRLDALKSQFIDLQNKLTAALEAVCNRFRLSKESRDLMVQFIAAERYSDHALNQLFSNCGLTNRDGFESCTSVRAVRNKVKKLITVGNEFEENRPSDYLVKSLSESLAELRARREETLILVRQLREEGVHAKELPLQSLGSSCDRIAGRVDQTGSILEHVSKLITAAKGLEIFHRLLG